MGNNRYESVIRAKAAQRHHSYDPEAIFTRVVPIRRAYLHAQSAELSMPPPPTELSFNAAILRFQPPTPPHHPPNACPCGVHMVQWMYGLIYSYLRCYWVPSTLASNCLGLHQADLLSKLCHQSGPRCELLSAIQPCPLFDQQPILIPLSAVPFLLTSKHRFGLTAISKSLQ